LLPKRAGPALIKAPARAFRYRNSLGGKPVWFDQRDSRGEEKQTGTPATHRINKCHEAGTSVRMAELSQA